MALLIAATIGTVACMMIVRLVRALAHTPLLQITHHEDETRDTTHQAVPALLRMTEDLTTTRTGTRHQEILARTIGEALVKVIAAPHPRLEGGVGAQATETVTVKAIALQHTAVAAGVTAGAVAAVDREAEADGHALRIMAYKVGRS
ncbi:hypothetical protein PRK78_005766 [Emydomyces testavorans]|uniref:Uncharacterized protein n=1 Tax=Emydomyces testavorans TaxID=2070801 RepID=A0AAF0IL17_9EURO|nr:hypothetical protein PRK78_005766 [Emydomyces testavorans]